MESKEIGFLEKIPDDLPTNLLEELERALKYSKIAAKFVDGKPVSFCYSGAETEMLWDISIDTLPDYRRNGYARETVSFMINYMAGTGKSPVYGCTDSNRASLELAKSLGFEPIDKVFLLTRQ